ncbi:MAG: 50S ribosomal protein L11 methyltransferase [Ruminococcaceae bacterium]|nr:50S ribosomal protein L11 methyltransferase [Oscillospiraceae bacterium]
MLYRKIDISIPHELTEELSNALIINGFVFFETYDYEDLEDSAGELFYDYIDDKLVEMKNAPVIVRLYFSDDTDEEKADSDEKVKLLGDIVKGIGSADTVAMKTETVDSGTWENNWKDFFHWFTVGEKTLVSPSWENPPREALEGRFLINIDPGGAFGSGTHTTTRLCLKLLEKYNGNEVLDMGCGSGILGIAAAKLGSKKVDAVDIDMTAAKIADENFAFNGIPSDIYMTAHGDVTSDEALANKLLASYDTVCANIVAGVIIALKEFFSDKTKKGGYIITSGILTERKNEVIDALSSVGFAEVESCDEDGWSAVVFERK